MALTDFSTASARYASKQRWCNRRRRTSYWRLVCLIAEMFTDLVFFRTTCTFFWVISFGSRFPLLNIFNENTELYNNIHWHFPSDDVSYLHKAKGYLAEAVEVFVAIGGNSRFQRSVSGIGRSGRQRRLRSQSGLSSVSFVSPSFCLSVSGPLSASSPLHTWELLASLAWSTRWILSILVAN